MSAARCLEMEGLSALTSEKLTAGVRSSPQDGYEAHVLAYLFQVRIIAHKIHASLPRHVELADLIGAGVVGLIDAVNRFDPEHDASLATFAQIRIRGAILDSLRAGDWGPRRLRQMARRSDASRSRLAASLFREPTEADIAADLGLSFAQYQHHLTELRSLQMVSFADPTDEDSPGLSVSRVPCTRPSPLQSLLGAERTHRVGAALESLPSREQRVIRSYYFAEQSMKEIGKVLGVTESRVCQIHAAALQRLKRMLAKLAS